MKYRGNYKMASFLGCYVPSIFDGQAHETPAEPVAPSWQIKYEAYKEKDHRVIAPCVGSCGDACFNHHCGANNNGYVQHRINAANKRAK